MLDAQVLEQLRRIPEAIHASLVGVETCRFRLQETLSDVVVIRRAHEIVGGARPLPVAESLASGLFNCLRFARPLAKPGGVVTHA